MTDNLKALKDLCEAGKLATEGEWEEDGMGVSALVMVNGGSPIWETVIDTEDSGDVAFCTQAANARPAIQWAKDRLSELAMVDAHNITLKRIDDARAEKCKRQADRIQTLETVLEEIDGLPNGTLPNDLHKTVRKALKGNQ